MADLGNISKIQLVSGDVAHFQDLVSGYTKNTGTITGIKMNGSSKGTSGVVDLGTVITAHQDISGKADKSATVSTITWDSTNNKLTKTINGSTTDVVTIATIKSALALPDPMVFKGSLGTGGTITSLPTAAASNKGYTYKVITAGTYASQAAKVGDTFISDGSSWVLIPSGDEPSGTVTSVGISGGDGISVSGSPITSSGTITLGLKLGYTTSGNNRAVQADSNGNLYVTQKDNNTTYSAGTGLSLSSNTFSVKLGYTTSGNNRAVQADSDGNLYVIQKDDNTNYSAGTGLSLSSTTFNHSNSVTAQTTQAVYPIKIDAQGHISAYGSAVTIGAAAAKGVTDNSSSADVTSSDTNLITGRTLYYQLAKKGYTTNTGTVTKVTAGTGLNTTGADTTTDGGNFTTSGTLYLTKSGVTAGSYGQSSAKSPGYGGTFSVPYVTVDKYGRVTAASSITITLPATDNTDEKVKQTSNTSNAWRKILTTYNSGSSATASITNNTTNVAYYNANVAINPSLGVIAANDYRVLLSYSGTPGSATGTDANLVNAITYLGWNSDVLV